MRKLIINADDFGLHKLINQAVYEAHRNGVLTSTSLLAGGEAFDEAAEIARNNPTLGVGAHLCLVGGLPTVCDPKTVKSLLDPATGKLYANYVLFTKKYFLGAVDRSEIYRELSAQVRRIKAAGVALTHIDSHQHMHMLPGITEIAIQICREEGICKSRTSDEGLFFTGGYPYTVGRYCGKTALSTFSIWAARKLKHAGIVCPDHFYGMLAGGNMQEQYLSNILDILPEGVSEIMMHPGTDKARLVEAFGFDYNWQAEYLALLSANIQAKINSGDIEKISFREL